MIYFQPMVNIFSPQEVSKYLAKTPWCEHMMSEPFGNAHEISRNWLYFYRLQNPMTKYLCNFMKPKLPELQEFAKSRELGSLDIIVEDWREISTTKTDAELAPLLILGQVSAGDKKKQEAKFEKIISDAMEHGIASELSDWIRQMLLLIEIWCLVLITR